MKNRSRKARVDRRNLLKQLHEILRAARTARCDDRDCHRVSDGTQQLQIEPVLDTVSVDRIDDHLSGTVRHTAADPVNGFHTGIVSAAARKDMQLTADTLYIDRQNNTLVAVALCRLADKRGIPNSAGIDAYLVRAAAENALEIVESTDTAADRQRDKYPAAGLGQNIGKQPPAFGRSGDIIKNKLVRALPDVDLAIINGNYAILGGLKVADALSAEKADSIAATTYANILAVRAGDENRPELKALIDALKSDQVKEFMTKKYEGAVVPAN